MNREEFTQALRQEGYAQVTVVKRPAGGRLDLHTHPFEAKALILGGEIRIGVDGQERCYRSGQVFHLARDLPHTESYGPAGVRYLVGRR